MLAQILRQHVPEIGTGAVAVVSPDHYRVRVLPLPLPR